MTRLLLHATAAIDRMSTSSLLHQNHWYEFIFVSRVYDCRFTKEDLFCATVVDSSNVYEDTNSSIAASDVYHDANTYLQDYYRKPPISTAFILSSSYGRRDAINIEQDILTTITSDVIQCITLLLYYSRIKHRRFDAHRPKTRLRRTKNLNRFNTTPTPTKEQSCVKNTGGTLFNVSACNISEFGLFFFSHHDCRESVSPILYDMNLHSIQRTTALLLRINNMLMRITRLRKNEVRIE